MKRRQGLLAMLLIAVITGLALQSVHTDAPDGQPGKAASSTGNTAEAKAQDSAKADDVVAATGTRAPLSSTLPETAAAAIANASPANARSRAEIVRAAHARLDDLLGCQAALAPHSPATRLTEWSRSLPDAAISGAADAYTAALDWAVRDCQPALATLSSDGPWDDDTAWLLAAGYPADDPLVQLLQARSPGPNGKVDINRVRAALYPALARALEMPNIWDFMTIADDNNRIGSGAQLGPFMAGSEEVTASVWMLAACDLGADCGPQSAAMRNLCLAELLCGYPSMDAAMIDAYWPQGSIEALSQMRRDLVTRLRRDGGVGIFEPVRPGGG